MSELVVRTDVPAAFDEQMRMAQVLAESTLLPAHLRGKPANVLIIIQGARAMGVSAFWALQSMFVVDGKLSMSSELMRALVIRAGHEFKIIEHTNKVARVGIKRKGTDYWFETEFTMQDAALANLTKKGPWTAYPAAMLLARVTSKICRAYCPDVLFGVVYTPEELGARVDEEGNAVINPDGSAVLEGEVVEVDQAMIDRIAELVMGDDLEASANAYLTAVKLGVTEMAHNVTSPDIETTHLRDLWIHRLTGAVSSANRDALKQIWKYANGTQVLDKIDPFIKQRLEKLDKVTKPRAKPAVEVIGEVGEPAADEEVPEMVKAARESWGDA